MVGSLFNNHPGYGISFILVAILVIVSVVYVLTRAKKQEENKGLK
jgi:cytochrome oxidase assembly protein ShyY1